MVVISITIIDSEEQIISGIPRFVSINTNIVSTIFYTLDGTDPTLLSPIYVAPIELPTDKLAITLKVFATNGIDSSSIITNIYQTDELGQDARTPHTGTDAPSNAIPTNDLYPFGTPPIMPGQQYLGAAEAGYTTYNPLLPATADGYDGQGNLAGFTNEPLIGIPTKTQPIILSESDAEGNQGRGIGTIPIRKFTPDPVPPEQSFVGSQLFDPKALVIFQDLTKPQDPGIPPIINRMNFTLEDVEHTKTGNQLYNTALDAPPTSGTFLRQHYNPTDNTYTYYYLDTMQNRWIISKTVAPPNSTSFNYASSMVRGKNDRGAGFVFEWHFNKANYRY